MHASRPLSVLFLALAACGGGGGRGGVRASWVVAAHGTGADGGVGISATPDGGAYVAGYFSEAETFGAGTPSEVTLVPTGTDDEAFLASYDATGRLRFAVKAGGPGVEDGLAVATAHDGDALFVGVFDQTATFDSPTGAQTIAAGTGREAFVARYHPDGTLRWVRGTVGTIEATALAVGVLPDDSAVVAGTFQGSVTFGTGEGNETTLTSDDQRDVFLARYDAAGALIYAVRAGGTGDDEAFGLAVSPDGTIAVVGFFAGTATFGPGEPQATTLVSAGADDVFLARYATDGTLLGAHRAGGPNFDQGIAVAAAADGTFLITGTVEGDATFGPGEAGEVTLTSDSLSTDLFLARYRADGTLAWVRHTAGTGDEVPSAVAITADGGGFVAGRVAGGGSIFGPGEAAATTVAGDASDAFVARYAADGAFVRVRRVVGPGRDEALGVAVAPDGHGLVSGSFELTADFTEFGSTDAFVAAGAEDVFVARLP